MIRRELLAKLTSGLVLPRNATPDEEIAKNFRHNFITNVGDMSTWVFAVSFISHITVLPVYASHLTSSIIVLSLIPAIREFGSFGPQILLAPVVEKLDRKYPLVIALAIFERTPYVLLPFVALWIGGKSGGVPTAVFMGLVSWMALGAGLVSTPWQEMMAKVIPVTNRGRFFSTGFLLGRMAGFAGTVLAVRILAYYAYPTNFIINFFIAGTLLTVCFVFITRTREPARKPNANARSQQPHYLKRLGAILRQKANFRRYLLSRWLIHFGRMPFGLMAVYAVRHFELPDSAAANFTAILYASSMIGLAVWGMVGDSYGHKRVMVIATSTWIIALLVAIGSAWWDAVGGVYLAFALMGTSDAGIMLADLNLAMEFGPEDERPTYIGLARSITGPALLIAPLIGGWLAETLGFLMLFVIALGFTVTGITMLSLRVREPRQQTVV